MPTYQYACTECSEQLEVVQSFSDAALTECPNCGGRLRKVYGAVGVVFKGSGFYKTDSRSEGKKAAASSSSDSGSSTPAKTESAPAAKSDSAGSSSTSSSSSTPSTPAAKTA